MFAAFIILCGFTHFFEVWTFYHPIYRFSGLLKAITAVISVMTAVMLIPIVPKVLNFTDIFRSILHLAPDGIIVVDSQGKIQVLNDSASNIFGYNTQDLKHTNIAELVPNLKDAYLFKNQNKQLEIKGIGKNKEQIDLEVSHSKIKTAENSILYTNIIRDVTKRKKIERSLVEKEQKFRIIFDSLEFACLLDLDSNVLEMNKSGLKLGNFKTKDVIGKNFFELDGVVAVRTPLGKSSYSSRKFRSEIKIIKGDNVIILDSSLKIIKHEGDPLCVLLEARDISSYKEIEKELKMHQKDLEEIVDHRTRKLKLKQSLLQTLLDSIPDIIYYKDKSKTYRGANKAFNDLMQREQQILETLSEDDEKAFEAKELQQSEKAIFLADGRKRLFETLKIPYFLDNEILGIVAINRDITEAKQRENALREAKESAEKASKVSTSFLANMSHEIRTPLHGILGFIEILLRGKLSLREYDYVTKMKRLTKTLLGIINDILDFSKIEEGKFIIDEIDFYLPDMIEETVLQFRNVAKEKEIEFSIELSKNVPCYLVGDSLRIRQILMNLLSNAFKFTKKGKVSLEVSKLEENDKTTIIQFSVHDTGIGIAQEQKEYLFTAFAQGDTKITRTYGGTGLGLSISKKLTELMNGKIKILSIVGVGSTFSCILPLERQNAPTKTSSSRKSKFGGKALILINTEIFEDQANDAAKMVKYFGFKPQTVYSLDEVSEKKYEVIITYFDNNDEVDAFLKNRKKFIADVPIVAACSEPLKVNTHSKDKIVYIQTPIEMSKLFDSLINIFGEDIAKQNLNNNTTGRYIHKLIRARILLVEDNEINQEIAYELLSSAACIVTVVNNGKEAVERLEQEEFDIVLMDVQMPIMDGYQATSIIRKNPKHRDLPIIAMTAFAMSGDKENCIKAGMNDYLSKPIDPGKLFSTIVKWTNLIESPVQKKKINPYYNIKGLNFQKGLYRANNNISLYKTLIINFTTNYKQTFEEIKQLILEENYKEARELTHKIKGVAANLSMESLSKISGDLEIACYERKQDESLKLWERSFTLFIGLAISINQVFSSEETNKEDTAKQKIATKSLFAKLEELNKYICLRSPKSKKILEELMNFSFANEAESIIKEIKNHVTKYKFNEAKQQLDDLMARLKNEK